VVQRLAFGQEVCLDGATTGAMPWLPRMNLEDFALDLGEGAPRVDAVRE
jgi:hypothetical protein